MKSLKTTKFILVVVFVLVVAGAIYFLRQSSGPTGKDIRRVIFISIDTCRADHLGCYGCPHQITPNIDKFADKSILFSNVISPVPMTLPAHCSMLTGTIPPYHGVHDNFDYHLSKSSVTLAEILKENGFATGAIISAYVLDSRFGLDRGFDSYNDKFVEKHKAMNINDRKGGEASHFALQWLQEHKDEKFFLFLHYFDPHYRYEPPEPFASKFVDSPYAGEIAYTDACIGQVVKKLKELRLYDSSLIVIAGDHGEMLGEHGEKTHMYFIYQSAIKVPLIFKFPGRNKSKRIDNPVGLIDIVPTICGALKIAVPSGIQGKDLFSKNRPGKNRDFYCESLYATKYGANSLLGIVSEGFKYIQTTQPELYNLVKDPEEMNNLVKEQPHRARILKDQLEQILEQSIRKGDSDSRMELDEQARKRLESLGYVSGSVTEDFDFDQSKDDPKDLIDFHKLDARIHNLVFVKEKYKEAKQICEQMLQQRPRYAEPYLILARIASRQQGLAESIPYLKQAIEAAPERSDAYTSLAFVLSQVGRLEESFKYFEQAARLEPGNPNALTDLAWVLCEQGRIDEGIEQYKKALEIEPERVKPHIGLGDALALQEKLDEAMYHWNKAIQFSASETTSVQNSLRNHIAKKLIAHDRHEQAMTLFNEIIQLDPNNI